MDISSLLPIVKEASLKAGEAILDIYDSSDFNVEIKGDNSPLTKADKAAHEIIVKFLESTKIPILSEEGKLIPYEERSEWKYFWMVDPLDGTKEFIKRNGEFTVNIALIHEGSPILGVVYAPVLDKLFYALQNEGAYMKNSTGVSRLKAPKFSLEDDHLNVVASRSHLNDATQQFLDELSKPNIVSMGSSLKFLVIAEGNAHLYPRYAPTMEWDTAAAQIILEEAGGKVIQEGKNIPVRYNKPDLLNPFFLAQAII